MRIRNREINVFSVSALDLFASALGAFILVSVVLMPYFLRVDPEEVNRLRGELRQARQAAEQAQNDLRECRDDLQVCEERLSQTFLAVVIQWPTPRHDVDLHIIDAAGAEFFYSRRAIPGRPGELSVDTTSGPGVEIWEVPVAPPGRYQVLYNLFSRHGNSDDAVVQGGVYYRDGHIRLGVRRLSVTGRDNAVLVAIVTVGEDGSVTVSQR